MNNLEAKTENEELAPETPMAAFAMVGVLASALKSVLHRVHQAAERSGRLSDQIKVVAVSKTKRVPLLREVYDAGHRRFSENYVQEIIEKSPQLPEDIEWHYIGNLQSKRGERFIGKIDFNSRS